MFYFFQHLLDLKLFFLQNYYFTLYCNNIIKLYEHYLKYLEKKSIINFSFFNVFYIFYFLYSFFFFIYIYIYIYILFLLFFLFFFFFRFLKFSLYMYIYINIYFFFIFCSFYFFDLFLLNYSFLFEAFTKYFNNLSGYVLFGYNQALRIEEFLISYNLLVSLKVNNLISLIFFLINCLFFFFIYIIFIFI